MNFGSLKKRAEDHWHGLSESQRAWRARAAITVLVAAAAAAAWYFGRPVWKRWQHGRALEEVRVFAEAKDYRRATLALRRAIELDPGNPSTWQQAARVLGEVGSPTVLMAREQLARLNPDNPALKLALVEEALRLERLEVAEEALSELATAARQDAAFYRSSAALAEAFGRTADVEANLTRLVELAPDDAAAKLNLEATRLWGFDADKQASALRALDELTRDPRVRVRAAVELLKFAARETDEARQRDIVGRMQLRFIPGWREDFPQGGAAGWAQLVEQLKLAAAADGAPALAVLGRWLAEIGQPRETLVWLESLPDAVKNEAAARDVIAGISAATGDLDRLEQQLRAGAWGVWPRDALTLAIASRLQQLRYGETAARGTWDTALTAAESSLPGLRALVRLASAWGDDDGLTRALEKVVQRFPKSFWAYDALINRHAARGDLTRLWQVYGEVVKQWPQDDERAARWILLGAILDRLTPAAIDRAEALHQAKPAQPLTTVTLAAVRWRQRRPADAVTLLHTLPSDETAERRAVTFWLALAQTELGATDEAKPLLQAAWRANPTLDEARLLQAAAARIRIRLDGSN